MDRQSLAVKYRPATLETLVGQDIVSTILKKQIELQNFKNCYLFAGPSGCGKTSTARCFARAINNGEGDPIEIDAASNGSVENIRAIIESANQRSLSGIYKIFIIDECVSGDTEVLTDKGWKRFDSLDKTEKIAQYTTNGKIEFVVPDEFIEKQYSGQMYKVSIGNKADFIMSPNHVQPLYYTKSGKIKESYIKDITFAQSNRFVRSGQGAGSYNKLTALDRLAIALQADGCLQNSYDTYNYWTIKVKKQTKKARLAKLLEASGCEFKKIKAKQDGVDRYAVKTPTTITKKLITHFNIANIHSSVATEFIKELMLWDGYHKQNSKYFYYSSTDKDNVDICQAIGLLGGFKSRIGIQVDNRKDTHKDSYRLYLEQAEFGTTNQHITKEAFDYDGIIYCVKVPSHMIVIRRNGFELITGNCHAITSTGWQAFLKGIEEPPLYTIFIFCTTEPNKLPQTILNRMQRYNISKIDSISIKNYLKYICEQEGFKNYDSTIDLISKVAKGCMRDAITMLDQCATYSADLSLENTRAVLGSFAFEVMLKLTNTLLSADAQGMIQTIDEVDKNGDIKQFVGSYLEFVLDLNKYVLFKSLDITAIPKYLESEVQYLTSFDGAGLWYNKLTEYLLNLKTNIKYDLSQKATVEAYLLKLCRGN